jgi:hypothetical protein
MVIDDVASLIATPLLKTSPASNNVHCVPEKVLEPPSQG